MPDQTAIAAETRARRARPGRAVRPRRPPPATPIACIHGFLETSAMWRCLPDRLWAGRSVICLTLPGHRPAARGASPEPMPRDLDALADRHADRLRQVCPGRQVRLVGHSTGAMAVLALALRHPDLVADGLLVAPLFSGGIKTDGALARALSLPVLGPAGFGWLLRRWLGDPRRYDAGLRSVMAPDATIPAAARPGLTGMRRDLRRCDAAALYRTGAWIGAQDLTGRLADLTVPMQAVLCQRDPVVTVAHQMQLVATAPMVDAVLTGTGHLPQIETPEAFAALFEAWRTRRRAGARTPRLSGRGFAPTAAPATPAASPPG